MREWIYRKGVIRNVEEGTEALEIKETKENDGSLSKEGVIGKRS